MKDTVIYDAIREGMTMFPEFVVENAIECVRRTMEIDGQRDIDRETIANLEQMLKNIIGDEQ